MEDLWPLVITALVGLLGVLGVLGVLAGGVINLLLQHNLLQSERSKSRSSLGTAIGSEIFRLKVDQIQRAADAGHDTPTVPSMELHILHSMRIIELLDQTHLTPAQLAAKLVAASDFATEVRAEMQKLEAKK